MKFWDPARPRLLNGYPKYCGPAGRPIAALQAISCFPREDGTWALTVFVGRREGEYYPQMASAACAIDVASILAFYASDPEQCLREVFGWEWEEPARREEKLPAPGKVKLTLADLGL